MLQACFVHDTIKVDRIKILVFFLSMGSKQKRTLSVCGSKFSPPSVNPELKMECKFIADKCTGRSCSESSHCLEMKNQLCCVLNVHESAQYLFFSCFLRLLPLYQNFNSVLSKALFSGWLLNHVNLSFHAILDCGFQKTNAKSENTLTFLR